MKVKVLFLILIVMVYVPLNAQVPSGLSFQAVVRDDQGKVLSAQEIHVQLSILKGSAEGEVLYMEEHFPTTNSNGLFTLVIGQGSMISGAFESVDWSNGEDLYVKREIDPTGGDQFDIVGSSKLYSVPFSFYSNVSDSAGIANSVVVKQQLSLSNDTIYLSDGGYVKLPSGTVDTDQQGLSTMRSGNEVTINIERGSGATFTDQVDDADADATNEIQTISKTDRTVTLSDNGGSFVDSILTEAQVDAFANNNGYLTAEVDGNTTNEIQVLSISNDTIYLSDGGYAKLPGDSIPAYGREGQLLYRSQGKWDTLAMGAVGQQLVINESGLPEWTTIPQPALSVSVRGDTLYSGTDSYVIIPGISDTNYPAIDFDGYQYDTVHIGTQVWMAENLRTTHYNDGEPIENVTDNATWLELTTGARAYYGNDSTNNAPVYGALYNWYAVETGKLCPTGWHVPTDAEWTVLTTFVGTDPGNKLKEIGTTHWNIDSGTTDVYGFTALPGGRRNFNDGAFSNINANGFWWSATLTSFGYFWFRQLFNYSPNVGKYSSYDKIYGFSVRCLRD